MESPCILVCSIDDKTGYCFGCGRTREEIGGWTSFTNLERSSIMGELQERLETVEKKPRRQTKRQIIAQKRREQAMLNTASPAAQVGEEEQGETE